LVARRRGWFRKLSTHSLRVFEKVPWRSAAENYQLTR
jgi:hypothetical protein